MIIITISTPTNTHINNPTHATHPALPICLNLLT